MGNISLETVIERTSTMTLLLIQMKIALSKLIMIPSIKQLGSVGRMKALMMRQLLLVRLSIMISIA